MASKEVSLEVAAFLDSSAARALVGPRREDVRRIAELFLSLCYEAAGKKPSLLDGQDVHTIFGHVMPGRLKRKDPLAVHVPPVLRALFDHLEATTLMPNAFEARHGLEQTVDEFLEVVRTGHGVHHTAGPPAKPVVHQAPKLGRNDPCFCGSGKKFKKCHGKAD